MNDQRANNADPTSGKQITGYCEPWSLRAGESVTLRASSHSPGPAELTLVQIHCGDPTKAGPGFSETPVGGAQATVQLEDQPLVPGSFGTVELDGLHASRRLGFELALHLTLPEEPQTILVVEGADQKAVVRLRALNGELHLTGSGFDVVLRDRPLATRRWYTISCDIDLSTGACLSLIHI